MLIIANIKFENMERYSNKTSLEYHKRQIDNPYESTKALITFLKKLELGSVEFNALDVACGSGVNLFEVHKNFPNWSLTGVDISNDAINLGKNYATKSVNHWCSRFSRL